MRTFFLLIWSIFTISAATWLDTCQTNQFVVVNKGMKNISYPDPTGPILFDQTTKKCTITFTADTDVVMDIMFVGQVQATITYPNYPFTSITPLYKDYPFIPAGGQVVVIIDGTKTPTLPLGFRITANQVDAGQNQYTVPTNGGFMTSFGFQPAVTPSASILFSTAPGYSLTFFMNYPTQAQTYPRNILFYNSQMKYIATAGDYNYTQNTSPAAPFITNQNPVAMYYERVNGFMGQILACSYNGTNDIDWAGYQSSYWDGVNQYLMQGPTIRGSILIATRHDDGMDGYLDVQWLDRTARIYVFIGCAHISKTGVPSGNLLDQADTSQPYKRLRMTTTAYTIVVQNGKASITLGLQAKTTNPSTTPSIPITTSLSSSLTSAAPVSPSIAPSSTTQRASITTSVTCSTSSIFLLIIVAIILII